MKFSFVSLFTKLTLVASASCALVSCDEPEYSEAKPITTASTAQGRYQIVNAAPGAGNAQLLSIDNVALPTAPAPIPYLGTAAYTNISAGQRLLLFSTATNLNSQQIPSRSAFNTGSSSTIFLTDIPTRASTSTDQGGVRTVVLPDNLAAPTNAANAKVRFINLSPSLTASGANGFGLFNVSNSTFLFAPTGRGYRATSYTPASVPGAPAPVTTNFANFTEVVPGTYTLEVRATVTATPNVAAQPITFATGKIYTLYTRGVASSTATPLGISMVTHN
ncbi:DUF4397 domain-containing protein [Hymenobacter terrenus]|uniref:DUF4397 domain-containing protein n=1 Tax=Hymenobacter terrenus TaxID=1629124 RepID=UPI000619FE61|nr:DUF4397 domain-containing protein [Hymenobacter terrenus]